MTIRRSVFVSVLLGGLVLVTLSGCSGGNPQMGKAEDAMKQERFEQALTQVDSALVQDSTNVDAYLLKADILRRQADTTMAPDVYKSFYEKARAAEEKALQVGSGAEGEVEKQRRMAYSTQSKQGTKAFRRARRASDPLIYRQAAAHFAAASATYPDSASVMLNEAYARLNQAQNREGKSMVTVIPTLERYLETARAPERNAYDILSALYLQDDQAQKAIDLLESAREDLSARPTHFRLEGTRGLKYSGTVEVGGTSRSVEGTTPGRVSLDAGSDAVSGTFSKKQKQGQLRVRLFYRGAAVADTTIASGKARLSAKLSEQTPLAELEGRLLNAYNQAGQTDKAMAEYEEQIEKNPNNATYRYNYGSMLLQADRYDAAIEQLQTAVELAPDNVKAHYNLGAAYSNKARQVQNQLTEVEDSLRSISEEAMAENREPTDEERRMVNELDQEKKDLRERKQTLFEKSIPPLKEAHKMSGADGSFRKDACTALVTAYVQTEQLSEAKKYEDCAGLQVGRRSSGGN
jgi:tetratricopeptide (TPR) repeat protein